ncbi:hypothetical protein PVAP13_3NG225200 [Panicum virgatum]|uniref:Uncharacterized protein n=1 Tax=Panicum virgatum TaxID=38727 RepID=A0A8T0U8P1_PANVG|nr:hypothetical protein PVAP13_3NG225200 [Panicum virgatum]
MSPLHTPPPNVRMSTIAVGRSQPFYSCVGAVSRRAGTWDASKTNVQADEDLWSVRCPLICFYTVNSLASQGGPLVWVAA